MVQPHDLLPHFEVTDLGGKRVQYTSLWQRKSVVLVMLPDSGSSSCAYADGLLASVRELNDNDTEWIVTHNPVESLPRPGVVVADQWGEVAHVAYPSRVEDLPTPDQLIDWVRYLQYRCPECEGEAK